MCFNSVRVHGSVNFLQLWVTNMPLRLIFYGHCGQRSRVLQCPNLIGIIRQVCTICRCPWTRWWLIPRRRGFKEGWWSVRACSLVGVESDSWCAAPPALWTGEGFGWGWLGSWELFSPAPSFLGGFMPLCLDVTTSFSHWWAPTVSVWFLLLPWLMVDSSLWKLPLRLIFVTLSWSTTITLSFYELAEEGCFGHACVFHTCNVASPAQLQLKQVGLYAGQAGCFKDFFVWHRLNLATWCHGWNASSVGETALVAWSASDRETRSLHCTGGWKQRRLCMPGSSCCGKTGDSAILSLTLFQRNCWLWTGGFQDNWWLWHHWRRRYPGK